MIPNFPEFKQIELGDKIEIEKITTKYPPYSDFNFTSMWSWNTQEKMKISILNDNLVVRFMDYISGESFCSFIGDIKINETIEELLKFSNREGLKTELKFIPEYLINNIDKEQFIIKEDINNFDYILSVKNLKDFSSSNSLIQRKKRAVNSLIKEHSPYIKILDLSDSYVQKMILDFINNSMKNQVCANELLAISRFIKNYENKNFVIIGAFVCNEIVGFSFTEILHNKFANFHFWKADIQKYKPMYSFILKESCRILHELYDCEFLNIEQDLGIENLRKWKSGFDSQFFLKKYTVSFIK